MKNRIWKQKLTIFDHFCHLKRCLFLFINLSNIRSLDTSQLQDVLSYQSKFIVTLVSFSSGVSCTGPFHRTVDNFTACNTDFRSVTIQGFTETEALNYMNMGDEKLSYDHVRSFCGTNPFLLSHVSWN